MKENKKEVMKRLNNYSVVYMISIPFIIFLKVISINEHFGLYGLLSAIILLSGLIILGVIINLIDNYYEFN